MYLNEVNAWILILFVVGLTFGVLDMLKGLHYHGGGYTGSKRPDGEPTPPKGSGNSKYYNSKYEINFPCPECEEDCLMNNHCGKLRDEEG